MPEVTETFSDTDNAKWTDLIIYAWACWTGKSALNLNPVSAGNLLGVVSTPETARYQVPLTDDQFILVDARYAQLPKFYRDVIKIQYLEGGYTDRELKRNGYNRAEWQHRIRQSLLMMYKSLLPEIEDWRP